MISNNHQGHPRRGQLGVHWDSTVSTLSWRGRVWGTEQVARGLKKKESLEWWGGREGPGEAEVLEIYKIKWFRLWALESVRLGFNAWMDMYWLCLSFILYKMKIKLVYTSLVAIMEIKITPVGTCRGHLFRAYKNKGVSRHQLSLAETQRQAVNRIALE